MVVLGFRTRLAREVRPISLKHLSNKDILLIYLAMVV